ncbi:MAG: LUD domain-containing protein [candidate division KSB1 bacterium]|nr:LUD domain-containing protein [candidate division KSB1 bacterium]
MNSSREDILKRIKHALTTASDQPKTDPDTDIRLQAGIESIVAPDTKALTDQFENELKQVSAEFHLIDDMDQASGIIQQIAQEMQTQEIAVDATDTCRRLADALEAQSIAIVHTTEIESPERKQKLAGISTALVEASFAIADIGSLVVLYEHSGTSLPHFLTDCVIAVVQQERLLANQYELFDTISPEQAKDMVFITGPSRTADIEKVLVLGAHGPRRLVALMIKEK